MPWSERGPGKTIEYYRCKGPDNAPSKCRNMISLDLVDTIVHMSFVRLDDLDGVEIPPEVAGHVGIFAGLEIYEREVIPGNDHPVEIAECEDRLRSLDWDSPDFAMRQASLLAERAQLQSLPATPATVEERATGRTLGDVWLSMGHAARRRYLLASGVRVLVADKNARMEGNPEQITGALRTIAA